MVNAFLHVCLLPFVMFYKSQWQVELQQKANSAKMLAENKALLREIEILKKELAQSKKFKAKLPNVKRTSPTS